MATEVAPPTRWLADEWENRSGYPSAVLSGIVPDRSHLEDGGYHVSINDLVRYGNSGDYSNVRYLDKAPPVTTAGKAYAAAVDMSMSRPDMVKLYGRALRVYNNRSDPRRRWLNAINVWDGNPDHAPRRLNFQKNTNTVASKDHTWHAHEDQPRAYVDVHRNEAEAWTAARAFISMVKGETVDQWQSTQGEDDMFQDADAARLANVERMLNKILKGGLEPGPTGSPENAVLFHIRSILNPADPLLAANFAGWKPLSPVGLAQVGVQLAALRAVVEGMAEAIRAGGGSVETGAILAGVDQAVDRAISTINAETRDAVADLGEGGAAQVRADE